MPLIASTPGEFSLARFYNYLISFDAIRLIPIGIHIQSTEFGHKKTPENPKIFRGLFGCGSRI